MLSKFQLLQRRSIVVAVSLPDAYGGGAGWPWVVGPTVPLNVSWVVFAVSMIQSPNVQVTECCPSLWILPAGIKLPTGIGGDPFFSNYGPQSGPGQFPARNFGPPSFGLRIDSMQVAQPSPSDIGWESGNPGLEISMFPNRPYVLLGPGETFLGGMQNVGTVPDQCQLEMRIQYSPLQQNEDFTY
jgi:hypothetical protein